MANRPPLDAEVTLRLPREQLEKALGVHDDNDDDTRRLATAKRILDGRRRRHALFPGIKFGDPSWDMILDLYLAERAGQQVSISDLCVAANVPTTTALRHIEALVEHGYMVRRRDPADGRRTFLEMTDRMAAGVETWLDLQNEAASNS